MLCMKSNSFQKYSFRVRNNKPTGAFVRETKDAYDKASCYHNQPRRPPTPRYPHQVSLPFHLLHFVELPCIWSNAYVHLLTDVSKPPPPQVWSPKWPHQVTNYPSWFKIQQRPIDPWNILILKQQSQMEGTIADRFSIKRSCFWEQITAAYKDLPPRRCRRSLVKAFGLNIRCMCWDSLRLAHEGVRAA